MDGEGGQEIAIFGPGASYGSGHHVHRNAAVDRGKDRGGWLNNVQFIIPMPSNTFAAEHAEHAKKRDLKNCMASAVSAVSAVNKYNTFKFKATVYAIHRP